MAGELCLCVNYLIHKHRKGFLEVDFTINSATIDHTVFAMYNSLRTTGTMTYNPHFTDSPIVDGVGRARDWSICVIPSGNRVPMESRFHTCPDRLKQGFEVRSFTVQWSID